MSTKISISGAQCSGKTTLITELKKKTYFSDFEVYTSPTRFLSKYYDMNFHTANTEIQLATWLLQMENTMKIGNGIFDRSVIDNLAYYYYYKEKGLCDVKMNVEDFLYDYAFKMVTAIDVHFILDYTEVPLQADGVREVDEAQRAKIHTNIIKLLDTISDNDYIIVKGSISERANSIEKYVRGM